MKRVLLTLFMVVAVVATMSAQEDEQTSMPVIGIQMDMEPIEHIDEVPNSDDFCIDFSEQYYYFVEIENTDENDVTIYYRITLDGEIGEWCEYVGPMSYQYEIVFDEIEAFAQADGKQPSEICHYQNEIGFPSYTFLATLYYIDGYYYISRELGGEFTVSFTSNHPFISGSYVDYWDDEPVYSGEIVVPDQVPWYGATEGFLTVEGVDYRAFANSDVTRVVMPNTILRIEDEAFMDCMNLTSVEIPNSVETIGEYAFADCSALTSIAIPASLHYIENDVFSGCTGLTNVEFHNAVYSIEERAFSGCTGLTGIELPNSLRSIYEFAFMGCTGLTSVTIPSLVSSIGNGAFNGCSGLTELLVQAVNPPRATTVFSAGSNLYNSVTLFVPDESLQAYQAHAEWGKFSHIVPFVGAGPGDVDGDGNIGINDVTTLIDQLLSGGEQPAWMDVNGDGEVGIADVTLIIDMILSGN